MSTPVRRRSRRVGTGLACAGAAALALAGCSSGPAAGGAAPAAAATGSPQVQADLESATTAYAAYVNDQVAQLVEAAKKLRTAVDSGSLETAAAAYPAGRVDYEQIEPVAESFGDLDPDIDARIDDPHPSGQWTGFHRLEKAIYADKSLAGMAPVAAQLVTDCEKLQSLTTTLTYQPAELGNGATSLLDEVGKTKVTGEEERYSHLDLLDMEANVAGAQKAFTLLRPALQVTDPALATRLTGQFADFAATIAPYRRGAGWVSYTTVTDPERRAISTAVNALAEPLSQLAAAVV